MNDNDKGWRRLVAAARRAPAEPDEAAPFGFSTRVAALAFGAQTSPAPAFGRLALRAAGIACLLAAVAVGVNFSAIVGAFSDEPAAADADDPVAEVVNLAS